MAKGKEEILYNWMFHYNKYNGKWHAFPREEYPAYFNGVSENVVAAEDFHDCVEYAAIKEMDMREKAARLRDK